MIVRNSLIPFRGFTAANVFGVVFVRRQEWDGIPEKDRARILRHERIHTAQMAELLVLPFYIIYFAEWLVRLVRDRRTAYERISFEREAYAHDRESEYLETRKHFAQWQRSSSTSSASSSSSGSSGS